jgi:hypothetical protein
VDESFERALATWVDQKRWSKVPQEEVAQWKEERWEGASGLKRSFDGQHNTLPLQMPLEYAQYAPNTSNANLFSRLRLRSKKKNKDPGPKMVHHKLLLER